jgi:polyhydroxyalkanoate synthesis regulator phasin
MNELYLYVALIGIALVLFALTRTKESVQATKQHSAVPNAAVDQELKDLLDDFMNELERDNAKLLDGFTKLQIEHKRQIHEQNGIIRSLEARVAKLEAKLAAPAAPPVPAATTPVAPSSAEETSAPALEAEEAVKPAFALQERYAQVISLARQGLAVEQIARETGIGVGEIQLVIGLAKRGER